MKLVRLLRARKTASAQLRVFVICICGWSHDVDHRDKLLPLVLHHREYECSSR